VLFPLYKPDLNALGQVIKSVISQKCDYIQFEYILIDDSGPEYDSNSIIELLNSIGFTYSYHKNPDNLGLANCWNRCVEIARYDYIHFVHQDDYIYDGYYKEIVELMSVYQCGLYATRSFFINENDLIFGVSPFLGTGWFSSLSTRDFFYRTPFQCSATVFSKSAFIAVGGFDNRLIYLLDRLLCFRIVKHSSGAISNKPLTNYRFSSVSETSRLEKTGLIFNDFNILNGILEKEDKGFDKKKYLDSFYNWSIEVLNRFRTQGFLIDYNVVKSSINDSFPTSFLIRKRINSFMKGIIDKLC
jgi:hypothetical protein